LKTWVNGTKGSVVKKIIDENFSILEKGLSQTNGVYVKNFTASDWSSGTIFIKQSEYNKTTPIIELYIKNDNSYSMVLGGYRITNSGVELLSDINYEGRVVIR